MAFLDDLLGRLRAEPGALTPERVAAILAADWGGQRVYVGSRPPVVVDASDTPASLQARGVRRSTAYNWVSRWRR